MKLSKAQRACLEVLASRRDDTWCNYGTACGVKRQVAAALKRRGLADYMPEVRDGVSARITQAGRAALEGSEK